jgi:hypothetical protein
MRVNAREKNIYFEFITIGNSIKASAIDPETSHEVSIIAPIYASKEYIKIILIKKLFKKI